MSLAIQNRNISFFKNIEKMSLRRKTVYKIIKVYGLITSHEIAKKMKLGINQVSGRVTELKEMCLIVEDGSALNSKTVCNNTLLRLASEEERVNLINAKYVALINEQKSLERDCYSGVSKEGLKLIKKRIEKIKKEISNLSKFSD